MSMYAVLTGDLIGSTRVSAPEAFRERLRQLLLLLAQTFQAQTSQFRGDGFQVLIDMDMNALRMALLIRTGLISHSPNSSERWDARLGIAVGKGDAQSADENSPVHVNSGKVLDSMGKENLCLHAASDMLALGSGVATRFVDDIVNSLTPTEAEILFYHLLERKSHASIANKVGKKRPTITITLKRARYHLLDRYCQDMDKLIRLDME